MCARFSLIVVVALASASAPASARTWQINVDGTGDAPTIQAAIDSAAAGDEIVVGPGRYTWTNQGGGSDYAMITILRGRSGFTLRGAAGAGATILDAEGQNRVIYIQGYNHVTIDGFTVTGGEAPALGDHIGGGVCAHLSTDDVIRNCIFTGNHARWAAGLWSGGWNNLRIEHCTFSGNHAYTYGGGIGIGSSQHTTVVTDCVIIKNTCDSHGGGMFLNRGMVRLENSVIAGNTAAESGGGVYANRPWPSTFSGVTIVANDAPEGGGIRVVSVSTLSITRSIIAFNPDGGAMVIDPDAAVEIGCCDLFSNGGGNGWPEWVTDLGGNFSLDPCFCDAPSRDYSLHADSPCLPGQHPLGSSCDLIGASGASCGGVPVRPTTWGAVKARYAHDRP